jgi:membrane-bound inhibitor of C-type lysozyme
MINKKLIILSVFATLICISGCNCGKRGELTARHGNCVTYQCENGDRIEARYYSLSDNSLNFVKLKMQDGKELTLPQALSASGARYSNDFELVWWIKGDSAKAEIRGLDGGWQLKYTNCKVIPAAK